MVRILLLGCGALVGATAGGWAVQSPEPRLVGYARAAGVQAGLPDLETASVGHGDIELRLWDGFGLTGIRGLILRPTRGKWQVLRVEPPSDRGYHVRVLPDTASWGERWKEAVAAGLRDVEAWADRSDGLVSRDGYAVVLELNESGRYRTAGSVAVDAACGTEARRLLEIAEILLSEPHGCAL